MCQLGNRVPDFSSLDLDNKFFNIKNDECDDVVLQTFFNRN